MDAPGRPTQEKSRLFLSADPRALEARLQQELAAAPLRDPFAPTWVVAPTRRILDHLAFALATKRGALAGFHFLHHQSLAAHVLEQAGAAPLVPASDALLEALLVERLATSKLELATYLAAQPAAIGALRATLRDLRDAGVDAAAAGRAQLSKRGREVVALLAEHEAIVAALERDGATDGAGVARAATRTLGAAKSRGAIPARLVHYGAYELIGVHRALVATLARSVPTQVFVAAAGRTERPHELAAALGARMEELASPPKSGRALELISAAGPREEMRLAARMLLGWHLEEKVPFEAMAILARGGSDHTRALQAEAALLGGAPDTSFKQSLAELPDALALRQIVDLATDPGSPLLADRVERAAKAAGRNVDADRALARDFGRGDAGTRVAALVVWASDRGNAALVAGLADAGREVARHPVVAADRAALARYVLQRLDARRIASEKIGRLHVLELHQARALPLERAVLIGANDRTLPRRASEDYFLSDADRRALRDATGAPLPLRGEARRDDELLFDTVCAAVAGKLVVTFARADADDRDAAPSPFLRRLGLDPRRPSRLVPRSPRAEVEALREMTGLLAPCEALAAEAARDARGGAVAAATALGLDVPLFSDGLARIAAIDSYSASHGAIDLRFDGGGVEVADRPNWSPSALEQLGICPLQFFFKQELGVKTPPDGYAGELDGRALGTLLHGALCRLYRELLPEGRPIRAAEALPQARERILACLEAQATATRDFPSLAPRFRRLRMEQLARDLLEFVAADLSRCETLGLRAVAFESEDEVGIAVGKRRLALKFKLDRLLADADGNEWIGDYKTIGATKLAEIAAVRWMVRGKSLQLPLYRLARQAKERRVGGLELLALRPPRRADDERHVEIDLVALANADADVADTLDALLELRDSGRFPLWSPPNHPFVRCSHCDFRRACRHAHAPTRARVESAAEHARFFALAQKTVARKSKGGGGAR